MNVIKRLINAMYVIGSIIAVLFGGGVFFTGNPAAGLIVIAIGLAVVNVASRIINYILFGEFVAVNLHE